MSSTLHTPTLIAKKRDGHALSDEEIRFLVEGFTRGTIPDYQMAAWAMAVYLRGMDEREATALTLAMAKSGQTVSFEGIKGKIVDKHSTGGVGDKVSLIVAPLVAAAGLNVAKLSGRGLGHTGGTIDKLEAIAGFQAALSISEMVRQVNRIGIALSESTHDLAPADKALYALRDVTATVGSLPLIASSIMSKKLAVSSHAIVLDVKVGRGALMKTLDQARALAALMVKIGTAAGRETAALLTNMEQPLGHAVGNALEVQEAVDTLQGHGPQDLTELCLAIAAQLLTLAQPQTSLQDAQAQLQQHLGSGQAFGKFKAWIQAQKGDVSYVEDVGKLPRAKLTSVVGAPISGYVQGLDALAIGEAATALGAGRAKKGDPIDHAVGVMLHAKVGDRLERGAPLATLHANRKELLEAAERRVLEAYELGARPIAAPTLIYERIL